MSNWSAVDAGATGDHQSLQADARSRIHVTLDELYPEGYHERDLRLARRTRNGLPGAISSCGSTVCTNSRIVSRTRLRPFRKLALRKAERWMLERFEGTDGLAAIFPAMLNSLIALKVLGYPDDHPQVLRAERELKKLEHETADSVRIEPCFSPVWDTAIVADLPARIGRAGRPPRAEDRRRVADGPRKFVFAAIGITRIRRTSSRAAGCSNSTTNGTRTWTTPRWCCWRCAKFRTDNPQRRDECFQRGLKWMMTFQCKDGGWAAFRQGLHQRASWRKCRSPTTTRCWTRNARTSPRAFSNCSGYEKFSTGQSAGAEGA